MLNILVYLIYLFTLSPELFWKYGKHEENIKFATRFLKSRPLFPLVRQSYDAANPIRCSLYPYNFTFHSMATRRFFCSLLQMHLIPYMIMLQNWTPSVINDKRRFYRSLYNCSFIKLSCHLRLRWLGGGGGGVEAVDLIFKKRTHFDLFLNFVFVFHLLNVGTKILFFATI